MRKRQIKQMKITKEKLKSFDTNIKSKKDFLLRNIWK